MQVLVCRVGQEPVLADVDPDNLTALQALVGGYLEAVPLTDTYVLVCNEEGRLRGLSPNVVTARGVIVGDVFVTKLHPQQSDQWTDLSGADVAAMRHLVRPIPQPLPTRAVDSPAPKEDHDGRRHSDNGVHPTAR